MRALISVSDKTGIEAFAQCLVDAGYDIVSTGGTARALKDAGISVIPVDDVTSFPEMMDGRVKTLHPMIHGGLLARRDDPRHQSAATTHGITMIDLVVVNLYPFESTVADPSTSLDQAIETIDIGGPSMIRSAAKNFRDVAVVVNPNRYDDVMAALQSDGGIPLTLRQSLAKEAFQHTAYYDAVIANYLTNALDGPSDRFPATIAPPLKKIMDLRYGENPHQVGAFYARSGAVNGLNAMTQHHGKALSYNNIMDVSAAWAIVSEFDPPTVAIIKHTNPCGVGTSTTLCDAYQRALSADPVSAFGSIVGCNQPVDAPTAQAMSTLFIEAIIAPSFDADALDILRQKPSIRLIEQPKGYVAQDGLCQVQGGVLIQSPDTLVTDETTLTTVTKRPPTDDDMRDLRLAFAICKHVKSNAIVLVNDGQTVGVGAGQMSRVDAVTIAIQAAGDKASGSVCASDAFFPFRDGVDALAKAGVRAIIQPGGSVKDADSVDAANENDMVMVTTGIRHFKH